MGSAGAIAANDGPGLTGQHRTPAGAGSSADSADRSVRRPGRCSAAGWNSAAGGKLLRRGREVGGDISRIVEQALALPYAHQRRNPAR